MSDNNFFNKEVSQQEENFFTPHVVYSSNILNEPLRRLNDYDSNILKEDAYKDISDEAFKLEYKISKLEAQIKDIDNQIQAARDIRDFELLETLFSRKKVFQEDLQSLLEIYNDTSLSAKISGGITGILPKKLKDHFSIIKKTTDIIAERLLSMMPQKFSTSMELKKSLLKLENINKSVDELMTLQTPYGEAQDKYEQLSKYIVKANNIQAEISKHLR